MNLTKLAIKRPVSMIIIVFALLVFGAMSIATTPLEMTPDIEMPMFVVMTTYPGAGPEDVEELVSKKVEDACSTLNGLKNVQSVSQENVSLVILELEYGSNMDIAHMDLQEKINRYKGLLPDNASDPIIMEMDVNGMPSVVLSASATGDINLLNYINESIVPEFEKLSGVASVDVAGGQEEYISVQLMEDRLRQYGLDIDTISALLSAANFSIPAGDADMGTQSLAVRAAVEYKTVESLRDVPIPLRSGGVIHLSDVAQIFRTSRDADSISRYNGVDNISLSITKRQSASTLDVSRTVLREVGRLNAADSGVRLDVIYDSRHDCRFGQDGIQHIDSRGPPFNAGTLPLFWGYQSIADCRKLDADFPTGYCHPDEADGILTQCRFTGRYGHWCRHDGRQLDCCNRELLPAQQYRTAGFQKMCNRGRRVCRNVHHCLNDYHRCCVPSDQCNEGSFWPALQTARVHNYLFSDRLPDLCAHPRAALLFDV